MSFKEESILSGSSGEQSNLSDLDRTSIIMNAIKIKQGKKNLNSLGDGENEPLCVIVYLDKVLSSLISPEEIGLIKQAFRNSEGKKELFKTVPEILNIIKRGVEQIISKRKDNNTDKIDFIIVCNSEELGITDENSIQFTISFLKEMENYNNKQENNLCLINKVDVVTHNDNQTNALQFYTEANASSNFIVKVREGYTPQKEATQQRNIARVPNITEQKVMEIKKKYQKPNTALRNVAKNQNSNTIRWS